MNKFLVISLCLISFFGFIQLVASVTLWIKARKIPEFGRVPKTMILVAPLLSVFQIGLGVVAIAAKSDNGTYDYKIIYAAGIPLFVSYYIVFIYLKSMAFRIIRVHVQIKNKKENTVSIIKSMSRAKLNETIYIWSYILIAVYAIIYSQLILVFVPVNASLQLCINLLIVALILYTETIRCYYYLASYWQLR